MELLGEGNDAFEADLTLTLHSYKMGLFLQDGKYKSGKVVTIPIGIPEHYNDAFFNLAVLIDKENFKLPERYYYANKNDYGRVFAIGGYMGYFGCNIYDCKSCFKSRSWFGLFGSRLRKCLFL